MNEYHFIVNGELIAYAESKEEAYEELKVILDEIYSEGSERWEYCWTHLRVRRNRNEL